MLLNVFNTGMNLLIPDVDFDENNINRIMEYRYTVTTTNVETSNQYLPYSRQIYIIKDPSLCSKEPFSCEDAPEDLPCEEIESDNESLEATTHLPCDEI